MLRNVFENDDDVTVVVTQALEAFISHPQPLGAESIMIGVGKAHAAAVNDDGPIHAFPLLFGQAIGFADNRGHNRRWRRRRTP